MSETFAQALEGRAQEVLDRCTRCGRCFEVCPMTAPAGLADRKAADVVGGVLDIIKGGGSAADSARWAQVCSGSGSCIPACPETVNPRLMLAMARVAMQQRAPLEEQREKGGAAFKKMGRGVRVLPRLQLSSETLTRIRSEKPANGRPDV